MYTGQDYLQKNCTHEEYYTQLVTPRLKVLVQTTFGKDRLSACIASGDASFKGIPLHVVFRNGPMAAQ